MKKHNKKGFTLVELLVVIAILAILSTVSVVGYLSFVQRAKESRATTELTQVREVVRGSLLDGSEVVVDSNGTDYTLSVVEGKVTAEVKGTTDQTLVQVFTDLSELDEGVVIVLSKTGISYTIDGVTATWTFATDEVTLA